MNNELKLQDLEEIRAAIVPGDGWSGDDWELRLCEEAIAFARRAAPVTPAPQAAAGDAIALLDDDELAALRRFNETCEDGEGYDVPKDMMQRLAMIGVVRRATGSFYQTTEFGLHVLATPAAAPVKESATAGDDEPHDTATFAYLKTRKVGRLDVETWRLYGVGNAFWQTKDAAEKWARENGYRIVEPPPAAASQAQAEPDHGDIFDLIREWSYLPEGQRGNVARKIIGRMNQSYLAGVNDGKALAAPSAASSDARDAARWRKARSLLVTNDFPHNWLRCQSASETERRLDSYGVAMSAPAAGEAS